MRRWIPAALLALCLTLALLPGEVRAAETDSGDWENIHWAYDSTNQSLTLTGSGPMPNGAPPCDDLWRVENLVIGEGITTISAGAFQRRSNLRQVSIPSSVTSIGDSAFSGCHGLTGVTFPQGLTSIGDSAFSGCHALTGVTFPQGLTSIGNSAFSDCRALTGVTFPQGLTSIGDSAFSDCYALTGVTLPGDNLSIGSNAFGYCRELTKATISGAGASIGESAFQDCDALSTVEISGDAASIGKSAFQYCDALSTVEISGDAASIGESAFQYCDALTAVKIQGNAGPIGKNAFWSCGALTAVEIGGDAASIGESAFWSCNALTAVKIQGNAGPIGKEAFYRCGALTAVEIGGDAASIGESAFYECGKLTAVKIQRDAGPIGSGAFSSCHALTTVEIQGNAGPIGKEAFSYCGKLTSVKIGGNLDTIGESAFLGVEALTEVRVAGSLGDIGKSAFADCTGLTSFPSVGKMTGEIYNRAFSGCTGLHRILLPEGVTDINSSAFENCESLTAIWIPASVTYFGSGSLNRDTVKDVYYAGTEAEWKAIKGYPLQSDGLPVIHYDCPRQLPETEAADNDTLRDLIQDGIGAGLTEIELTGDIDLGGNTLAIEDACNVLLDLKGHRITSSADPAITIVGALTVKDSTETAAPAVAADHSVSYDCRGSISGGGTGDVIDVQHGGAFTLQSGTIRGGGPDAAAITVTGPRTYAENEDDIETTVTIEGGCVEAAGPAVLASGGTRVKVDGGVLLSSGGEAVILGGAEETECVPNISMYGSGVLIQRSSQFSCGVYLPRKGYVYFSSGRILVENGVGILLRGGHLSVSSREEAQEITAGGTGTGTLGGSAVELPAGRKIVLDQKSDFCGLGRSDLYCTMDRDLTGGYAPEGIPRDGYELKREGREYFFGPAVSYQVTFDPNGGTGTVVTMTTDSSGRITAFPPEPTRPGYVFRGWRSDPNYVGYGLKVGAKLSEDTTLYALWTPEGAYIIEFRYNYDISLNNTVAYKLTDTNGVLSDWPDLKVSDGTLLGWFTNSSGGEEYSPDHVFTGDTVVWGHFPPSTPPPYDITFDPNGGSGSTVTLTTDDRGKLSSWPADPTRDGYVFMGWSQWSSSASSTVGTGNTFYQNETLYAHWMPEDGYVISFSRNEDGSGTVSETRNTGLSGRLRQWPDTPQRPGTDYIFSGWYTGASGGSRLARDHHFYGDTRVYAHWLQRSSAASSGAFVITFDPNGGDGGAVLVTEPGGRLAFLPYSDPVRSGYTFSGWYTESTGGSAVSTSTVFRADTTVYAHWTPDGTTPPGPGDQFAVTFDSQGGSAVASQTVAGGGKVTQPANPTRTGYTFTGWFKEAACTNDWKFDTDTVSGNITLYAKWTQGGTTQEYTVTFDTQGGSAVAAQTVASGGKVTRPASNPTRTGYTFGGWYKEAACTSIWNFDTETVSANTTLFAKWTSNGTTPPGPGDQFTVTFDSQGGSAVASQTVAGGGKVTQPANPTRTSYTFAGWYKEAACTNDWKFDTDTVSGNTTLYAKWTSNGTTPPGPGDQFTVTFDPNGGTGGGPLVTGTDGRLEALPGIPVRAGYVFEGWYTAVSGGTQVTTATVFTQNVTVYARWRSQTAPTVRHRIYTPYRTPGGSLYVSHTYAAEGTRVTIEVDPRTNFELDWISVTNLDTGRELRLTSRYGDEYTFTMPDGDVEVDAAFTGRSSGGSSSGYVPADPPRQQASVKPVRWYYRNGSIYHVTDGLVPAASPLTRDMLVSVLYNMDETSSGDQELWATGSAILPNIYDSGLWGTDMALSREQTAMILFQYARYKGYNISQRTGIEGYYDYAQVRPVARIAVSWARAAGLINGISANALSPKSQLSCGEANVILSRFTANVV